MTSDNKRIGTVNLIRLFNEFQEDITILQGRHSVQIT
jgi:hypothetical protein